MEDTPSQPQPGLAESPLLPGELRDQLLMLVADRLAVGEILITAAHFQKAMEEGYQTLTHAFPSTELREHFGTLVNEMNENNPEAFVGQGLENWITRSFLGLVRKQKWGVTEMQERGHQAIREFVRQDSVKALLEQLNIAPSQLNIRRCLSRVTNQLAGREDAQQKRSAARLAQVMSRAKPDQSGDQSGGLKVYMLEPAPEPTEAEIQEREQEQKQVHSRLRKDQLNSLVQHLDTYVQQGKLTEEEADKLRKLHTVDEAVKTGRVSREKGSRVRNSILTGDVRFSLEKKVREAVDYVVLYLQVFHGLKRIDSRYDDGFCFLIRNKEAVNDDRKDSPLMGPVVEALTEDLNCLQLLIGMMDRQDAEMRMIAARLPPYSHMVRPGQDRVENLVIEEGFVDDLRRLSEEEMSTRLNAGAKKVVARSAADMLCLCALVHRLLKPTPLRKELRLLKVNLMVEEFYRSTDNVEEARARAQDFLKTRLRRLYPDLSEEESAAIDQRGEEIIQAVEQKIVAERQEELKARGEQPQEREGLEPAGTDLSEEEIEKGVQIGRVAIRVAGIQRLIAYKIIPDTEDATRFVLAKKDPDTGELVPVVRRGAKRYVEKNREGIWVVV